jgi:hypothetical protein
MNELGEVLISAAIVVLWGFVGLYITHWTALFIESKFEVFPEIPTMIFIFTIYTMITGLILYSV